MYLKEIAEFQIEKKNDTYKQIFMELDTINSNNRYYPSEQFRNNYNVLKQKIERRSLLGELEHPYTDSVERIYTINLKEVQIMINDIYQKGKTVYGEFKVLNTPNGILLKNLLENNVTIGVSLRGIGDVETKIIEGKEVDYVIPENFEIVTWDVVHTPGFESQTILTESIKYINKQLYKGKLSNFEEYVLYLFTNKLKQLRNE